MKENEDGSVTFTMSKVEWDKYKVWKKSLPKIDSAMFGAAGGGTTFEFTPTGLGIIVAVRRADKEKHYKNLTDFETWG